MSSDTEAVVALERRFWQSMVDGQPDVALSLLAEPSAMVSTHGAMTFDHAAYRRMAEQGTMVVESFELSRIESVTPSPDVVLLMYRVKQRLRTRADRKVIEQEMFDTSAWVRLDGRWRCAMHTETPVPAEAPKQDAR